MSENVTIRTSRGGNFNSTVTTSLGKVSFDAEGIASVPVNIAEFLVGNFPKKYYYEGEEKPTPVLSENPRPIQEDEGLKEFTRNLAKVNSAEAAAKAKGESFLVGDSQIAVSSTVETETAKIVNPKGEEVVIEVGNKEEVEAVVNSEEVEEEVSTENEVETDASIKLKEELMENSIADLRELCSEAEGVEKSEWASFKGSDGKKDLVDFIVKKGLIK